VAADKAPSEYWQCYVVGINTCQGQES